MMAALTDDLHAMVNTINSPPEAYAAVFGKYNFYDTLKAAAVSNVRLPTAEEEQAHYAEESARADKLENAGRLKKYFFRDESGAYIFGYSSTGLRFQEADIGKQHTPGNTITAEIIETTIPQNILTQIADPVFRRTDFNDIIRQISSIAGIVEIPYARGHVIGEMKNGIFTGVKQTFGHREPFALHGWTTENLGIEKDPISSCYDAAVGRYITWHNGSLCMCVATEPRHKNILNSGFRPIALNST